MTVKKHFTLEEEQSKQKNFTIEEEEQRKEKEDWKRKILHWSENWADKTFFFKLSGINLNKTERRVQDGDLKPR